MNSSADFFVRRIDDWREHLVVLHRGARATIFRPDATLFLLLKLARLSEVDLADCLTVIGLGEAIDRVRVQLALDRLPATEDLAARARRETLRDRLG